MCTLCRIRDAFICTLWNVFIAVCVNRDICMHMSRTVEFVMHSYVHLETYSSTVLVNASQTLEFVTYAYIHVHMNAFQRLHMNAFRMNVSRTLLMSS